MPYQYVKSELYNLFKPDKKQTGITMTSEYITEYITDFTFNKTNFYDDWSKFLLEQKTLKLKKFFDSYTSKVTIENLKCVSYWKALSIGFGQVVANKIHTLSDKSQFKRWEEIEPIEPKGRINFSIAKKRKEYEIKTYILKDIINTEEYISLFGKKLKDYSGTLWWSDFRDYAPRTNHSTHGSPVVSANLIEPLDYLAIQETVDNAIRIVMHRTMEENI